MAVKKMTDCYCVRCQRNHAISEFYKSVNPFHPSGYIPYCKDAIKEMVGYYINQTKNLECAIWLSCSLLGVPFIKKAYDGLEETLNNREINKGSNYFAYYLSKLVDCDYTTGERQYKDFSSTDVAYGEINTMRVHEEAVKADYAKFELDWGKQTPEDYEFLENIYYKYTEDLELDSQQEDLYRDLCLARLRKRRMESGIDGEFDENALAKIQTQIFSIMNKLKIDEFEKTQKSPVDLMIFERIKMVEETMPCEVPDKKKYKDVTGIGKYLKDLVYRPMLNTLVGARDFNVRDVANYEIEDIK